VNKLTGNTIPKKNFLVRRRRYKDSKTTLIIGTHFIEVDLFADVIWLMIDGKLKISDIAEKIAYKEHLEPAYAYIVSYITIYHFHNYDLVELSDLACVSQTVMKTTLAD